MEGRDNGRRSRSLVTRPLQRARTFGPRDQDPVRLLFPSRQIAFARRSPRIHLEPCKCCPDHPASRYTHLCQAALTEALQQHVKQRIGVWKYPRWIECHETLPKTATGKIQRYKLRQG